MHVCAHNSFQINAIVDKKYFSFVKVCKRFFFKVCKDTQFKQTENKTKVTNVRKIKKIKNNQIKCFIGSKVTTV